MNKPNILLVMCDQLRADHLSAYGCDFLQTPQLDRIGDSAVFERAYTVNPLCMPARSALLTGKYSRQIGCLQMSGDLAQQHPTFPRALQGAGYHTALIGKLHVMQGWPWQTPIGAGHDLVALEDAVKGYGFDSVCEVSGKQLALRNRCHFTEHLRAHGQLETYREFVESEGKNANTLVDIHFTGQPWPFAEALHPDIFTADRVVDFLEKQDRQKPFFLQASFCSPHPPYDPPERFLEGDDLTWAPITGRPDSKEQDTHLQAMARAYRGLVRMLDAQMGRIWQALEASGQLDNTVVCLVSDHGEMLGDHGAMQKSSYYDSSARIPLMLRDPQALHESRVAVPVEITDLAATLLDYAGLDPTALNRPWPAYGDLTPARSLRPLALGQCKTLRETAYSECYNWQMLTDGRHKYVRIRQAENPGQPEELLFDLNADPTEQTNLAANPTSEATLSYFRQEWLARMDALLPAQTQWATYGEPL